MAPFYRYLYKLRVQGTDKVVDAFEGSGGRLRIATERAGTNSQLWSIMHLNGEANFSPWTGDALTPTESDGSVTLQPIGSGYTLKQTWLISYPSSATTIKTSGRRSVYVDGDRLSIKGDGVPAWCVLEKTDQLKPESEARIASDEERLASLRMLIAIKKARLDWLTTALASTESASTLNARLTTVRSNRTSALNDLTNANSSFLSALTTAPPATMPVIATDARGLSTYAAALGFARTDSRFAISESCEGSVLLSYFDKEGRMRTTVYDAVADSRNETFEQWVPDALRACPHLRDINDKISLSSPVTLPADGWTCEAWVQFPLATTTDGAPLPYNAVVASAGPAIDSPLVVRNGNRLGLLMDGFYFDSGAELRTKFAEGWHHLAATTSKGRISFYVDGERLGGCIVGLPALRVGSSDRFESKAYAGPTTAVTVTAWVRNSSANWSGNGPFVSQNNLFKFECVTGTCTVKFSVYANNAWASASYTPTDILGWHFYAATYDGTGIQLFIDGLPVQRLPCTGSMSGALAQLVIGASGWTADIADVTVHHRTWMPNEIRDAVYRPVDGTATSCAGAWRMVITKQGTTSTIQDVSSNARHATVVGTPVDIAISPGKPLAIQVLGNIANGQFPIGRFADVRLWGLCLSNAEIAVHAKTQASGSEPGLLAFWPLDEGRGTSARERSGAVPQTDGTLNRDNWIACTASVGRPSFTALRLTTYAGMKSRTDLLLTGSFTVECWVRRSSPAQTEESIFCVAGLDNLGGPWRLNVYFDGYKIAVRTANNNADWQNGIYNEIQSAPSYGDTKWHHVAVAYNHSAKRLELIVDGLLINGTTANCASNSGSTYARTVYVGAYGLLARPSLCGDVAELRVWGQYRSTSIIATAKDTRCLGTEDLLLACYPLVAVDTTNMTVKDLKSGSFNGTILGNASILRTPALDVPLPSNTGDLITAEYSSVELGSDGATRALMRRFYAFVSNGAVEVLPEKRIEELSMQWVGNTQIKPTLLGYIEGAPPVPSENLTVEQDDGLNEGYNEATTVTLSQSNEVTYSWQKSEGRGFNLDAALAVGIGWNVEVGFGVLTKTAEGHVHAAANYAYERTNSEDSSISSISSLTSTDSLTLRGMFENGMACPRVGKRWLPKNVGYALVLSGMADVFVMRLKRSGRMVSYEVRPIDGVPLDVNTITFMINPAYTLNGSLDGLVGSSPADPTLYGHVPDLRAQYGALYPASYMRLKEAYELKDTIARLDKERETFFRNFNAQHVYDLDDYSISSPPTVPGSASSSSATSTETDAGKAKQDAAEDKKAAQEEAKEREALIQQKLDSLNGVVRAGAAFADWQKRMEGVQLRSGKRNIANTYVWDGDGLHAEEESFAGTVEHSIMTESVHSGQAGIDAESLTGGFALNMSLMIGGGETHAFGRTLSTSRALSLSVDLSGVERRGITDLWDDPIVPGEKVDRYRFMSFYLENDTNHFHDFFRYVVDPDWLMSNDEEARALREAQQSKPNRCWRVLHRVTYVERPALKRLEK